MNGLEVAIAVAVYVVAGVIVGAVSYVCTDGEDLPPPIVGMFSVLWPITIAAFVFVGAVEAMGLVASLLGDVLLSVRDRLK
jgi:hypothetical protein